MVKCMLPRHKKAERNMVFQKGVHCRTVVSTMTPSTSYELAVGIFPTQGGTYATCAIVDTGSSPSFIRKQLVPKGSEIQPLGEPENMMEWRLASPSAECHPRGARRKPSESHLFWGGRQDGGPGHIGKILDRLRNKDHL